jgi:hypothetical protein
MPGDEHVLDDSHPEPFRGTRRGARGSRAGGRRPGTAGARRPRSSNRAAGTRRRAGCGRARRSPRRSVRRRLSTRRRPDRSAAESRGTARSRARTGRHQARRRRRRRSRARRPVLPGRASHSYGRSLRLGPPLLPRDRYRPTVLIRGCAALSVGEDHVTRRRRPLSRQCGRRRSRRSRALRWDARADAGSVVPVPRAARHAPIRRVPAARLRHLAAALPGRLLPARPPGFAVRVPRDRIHHLRSRGAGSGSDRRRPAWRPRRRQRSRVSRLGDGPELGDGDRDGAPALRRLPLPDDPQPGEAAHSSDCRPEATAPFCSRSTTSTPSR